MTLSTVIFFSYFFYQTFSLTLVKKYLKTAKIIDESLILVIDLRNYFTKRELKVRINVTLKPMPKIFGTCVYQFIKV
jgi:hypothetical protein